MSSTWRDPSSPSPDRLGPSAAGWRAHATATVVHATLQALLDAAPAVGDPLAAALLGSDACGVWWAPAGESEVGPAEHEHLVGRAYAAHLEQLGTAEALAALRALQLGGSDGVVPEAAAAAARLRRAGRPEPSWWSADVHPVARRGARLSWTDDGVRFTSLMLEVTVADDTVTMAVATVDDRAGVVGDVLLFADLDGFCAALRRAPAGHEVEWLDVPTVARGIRAAIDRTDLLGVGDPPGSSVPEVGYVALRAVAQRWSAPSAA